MSDKNIIVTGGAGYIGSHACKDLKEAGYIPITVDNLITGWEDAVKYGPLEKVDLLDAKKLETVFTKYSPLAVMHFASLTQVNESVKDPGSYWHNNVMGALNLINTCIKYKCNNIIFSSTCAVYGEQSNKIITERKLKNPLNAYGCSKNAVEEMIKNFSVAYGLQYVVFRYFNVAGADPNGEIGEYHLPETHLIPLTFHAINGKRKNITVYGTDYDTFDGTCIRDYVHVCDIVAAHTLGLKWLLKGGKSSVFNLGTGKGFSVNEIIKSVKTVTGKDFEVTFGERRKGDCKSLISGLSLAQEVLGWQPKLSDVEQIIKDAWNWENLIFYKK